MGSGGRDCCNRKDALTTQSAGVLRLRQKGSQRRCLNGKKHSESGILEKLFGTGEQKIT